MMIVMTVMRTIAASDYDNADDAAEFRAAVFSSAALRCGHCADCDAQDLMLVLMIIQYAQVGQFYRGNVWCSDFEYEMSQLFTGRCRNSAFTIDRILRKPSRGQLGIFLTASCHGSPVLSSDAAHSCQSRRV